MMNQTDECYYYEKEKRGIVFLKKVQYVTRPHASTTQHQDSLKIVVFSGKMVLHV